MSGIATTYEALLADLAAARSEAEDAKRERDACHQLFRDALAATGWTGGKRHSPGIVNAVRGMIDELRLTTERLARARREIGLQRATIAELRGQNWLLTVSQSEGKQTPPASRCVCSVNDIDHLAYPCGVAGCPAPGHAGEVDTLWSQAAEAEGGCPAGEWGAR